MNKNLSNLSKRKVPQKSKRVGRGYGSGKGGHTSSRGNKGQKSRTGGKAKLWFEGGQTPLIKRMPYSRGFKNHNEKKVYSINLATIQNIDGNTKNLTPEYFFANGLIRTKYVGYQVKILGKGKIDKPINLKGFLYSKTAREKIISAGGKAE